MNPLSFGCAILVWILPPFLGRVGGVMACVKLAPYFEGKILPLVPSKMGIGFWEILLPSVLLPPVSP